MPNKISFFAPGKLYLAGEYAVTQPRGQAIIMPVKKGIKVTVESQKQSSIVNLQYPLENITFKFIEEIKNPYLRLAIEVVRQWTMIKGMAWKPFKLIINSTLVAEHGKYGLGSSGAITVAVIGALLKFYGIAYTPLMLYQLAVIATIQNYPDTSFGDLACSSFNQIILYQKFTPHMFNTLKTLHVDKLLNIEWEGLIIKPVEISIDLPVVVYSGSSADSHQMVKKVQPYLSQMWVEKSNQLVQNLLVNFQPIMIQNLQQHLLDLEKQSQAGLVTEHMQKIIQVANEGGGVAKMSGAGGGDCMLVFIAKQKQSWFAKQMKSLNFVILSDII
jgi:phosphomevalonate kinase